MAGPQKFDQYQMALRLLADARLAVITDDVESRYALDDAWGRATNFVLSQAPWRFALRTAALIAGGSVLPGYVTSYAYPADWLRTHAIYIALGGRECPFDLREQGVNIQTPALSQAPTMRFVSSNYLDPAVAAWPEHFSHAHAAYLAFLVAVRVTGEPGAAGRMSQLFSQLLAEAQRIDAVPEDPWLPYQRDGSFLRVSRTMIDQAFWRFATKTVTLATSASTAGAGFSRGVEIPLDWSRTRSLYVLTSDKAPTGAGERRPFKIREHAGFWFTDAASFSAEYVSATLAMDSTQWPDHYMRAVLRALHFDESTRDDDKDQKDDLAVWKDALADTVDSEADAPDPWLPYQQDGSFDSGSRIVIARGYWWWALKDLQIDSTSQLTLSPAPGFPYRYKLPDDWLRTYKLFVPWDGRECPLNIRETAADWSTDAQSFVARYVSTDALDPTTWPESVAQAVLAYLDWRAEPKGESAEKPGEVQADRSDFNTLIGEALGVYSQPEDDWLRFQLSGRYIEAVQMIVGRGHWRFAVKTVTLTDPNNTSAVTLDPLVNPPQTPLPGDPTAFSDGSVSPGYACRMLKPNDWLRTLRVYYSMMNGVRPVWLDVDFRDELGAIHANYNPLQMRYISRLGLDATQWSPNFRDAVLAWLEHSEARSDPKMAAVAKAKFELFTAACQEAMNLDDENDVPAFRPGGRFVAGRYGRRGSGSFGAEQAWPPFGF